MTEQQPLRDTRDKCRASLREIQDEIRLTKLNASSPKLAYAGFGPSTDSFTNWWMWGLFVPVLLAGDKSHNLWNEAIAAMDFVAERSGYRTEGRDLPKDADRYRALWDSFYADANSAERAPTGKEVVESDKAFVEAGISARLQQAALDRNVTEDHRRPKPAREYMDVQRLRNVKT